MDKKSQERKAKMDEFLLIRQKLDKLEEENSLLKETNFSLSKRLEEKENAVENLFSIIEDLKK
jgi:thiamine kinase-like enzyme